MATITVIDNKFFTLRYHEEAGIVHHQIHRFLHGEDFRSCLMEGVALLKARKACKWLSDDRNNAALPKDDFEWSTREWRPTAIEAGWKYWALVLPEKIVGQMSMNNIIKTFYGDGPVTVKLFSDPDLALQWLEAQP